MSAGTITLTNKSAVVSGNGTSFTKELAAGDFIVATVGGIAYTLPVLSITSATSLTLVSNFTGPTQSGNAWNAIPRVALNMVTAALVTQSAEALRGLNYDKQNWQSIFTGTGAITVTLPDGSVFSGPSWKYLSDNMATKSNGAVPIAQGGTGAKTKEAARTNLGLGTSNTPFFASLELSDGTPFLDFHHESTTNDYSARLWAPSAATLELKGGSGGGSGILKVEGGYQCRSGTKGTYSASVFNMLWTSGAMRLYVDTSDVGAITVTSSDRELKENIVYQTDRGKAAEEVSRWRVALFDMKARGVLEKSVGHLGFIANDMLETSPEVVKGTGLPEGVDLENDDLSGMFYLDPMAAIAKLTLTIQLLQEEVAQLKEK